MRLKLNEDNYITGYGCFGNVNYPEYDWTDKPEKITGEYNQPLYYWDAENETIVYKPIGYTDEQTEELRKAWCQTEIRAAYSESKEAQILRENMNSIVAGSGNTEDYETYNAKITAIIAESKEKDFQLAEGSE